MAEPTIYDVRIRFPSRKTLLFRACERGKSACGTTGCGVDHHHELLVYSSKAGTAHNITNDGHHKPARDSSSGDPLDFDCKTLWTARPLLSREIFPRWHPRMSFAVPPGTLTVGVPPDSYKCRPAYNISLHKLPSLRCLTELNRFAGQRFGRKGHFSTFQQFRNKSKICAVNIHTLFSRLCSDRAHTHVYVSPTRLKDGLRRSS